MAPAPAPAPPLKNTFNTAVDGVVGTGLSAKQANTAMVPMHGRGGGHGGGHGGRGDRCSKRRLLQGAAAAYGGSAARAGRWVMGERVRCKAGCGYVGKFRDKVLEWG
eukprot:gene8550-10270_t